MQLIRYQIMLITQVIMLFFDIFCNAFSELLGTANVTLLIVYVVQDIFILFIIIITFLQFFNTFIFQAGLAGFLIGKFKATIITTFVYLMLCIGFHAWSLTSRWEKISNYPTSIGFTILYVVQRTWAVLYYYFVKRTALRLGDEYFYKETDWLRKEFEKRR